MASRRISAAACRLADGRFAVIGGYDEHGKLLDSAEVYNPKNQKWTPLPPIPTTSTTTCDTDDNASSGNPSAATNGRLHSACAVGLADGRLMLIGGADYDERAIADVFVLDPVGKGNNSSKGEWKSVARMQHRRKGCGAVLLADGKVMVLGGAGSATGAEVSALQRLSSTELYDPSTDTWTEGKPMLHAREDFACCRLVRSVSISSVI